MSGAVWSEGDWPPYCPAWLRAQSPSAAWKWYRARQGRAEWPTEEARAAAYANSRRIAAEENERFARERGLDPQWFDGLMQRSYTKAVLSGCALRADAKAAEGLALLPVRPETEAMVHRALREQRAWDRYFQEVGR